MNLNLQEYHGNELKSVTHRIKSFKKISEPKSTLLAFKRKYVDEENIEHESKMIYKLQFIASCKTTISKDELLIAFYINDEWGSYDCWIINIPPGFENFEGEPDILDYQAYLEICELTGEMIKSFPEYLNGYTSDVYNTLYHDGEKFKPLT